jgi:tetratricopeptide (TPR) repeat protein
MESGLRLDPANARTALYLGQAYYFLGRYGEAVAALDRALAGNLGHNTQIMGRPVLAAAYAELDRPEDAARERNAALQLSPFLDASRFAGQFGTTQARDRMLEGLKKAGFR